MKGLFILGMVLIMVVAEPHIVTEEKEESADPGEIVIGLEDEGDDPTQDMAARDVDDDNQETGELSEEKKAIKWHYDCRCNSCRKYFKTSINGPFTSNRCYINGGFRFRFTRCRPGPGYFGRCYDWGHNGTPGTCIKRWNWYRLWTTCYKPNKHSRRLRFKVAYCSCKHRAH